MTSAPLLSVCIPTFNRALSLQTTLTNIHGQLCSLPSLFQAEVEVLIVDNASSDDTSLVGSQFASAYPDTFRFVRRPQSVGFSNVLLCSAFATGRYVWLVSDDDVLLPGALRAVLELLESEQVDAVSISAGHGVAAQMQNGSESPASAFALSAQEIMGSLGSMITFMSVLIYRRSLVVVSDYAEMADSYLEHSYAFADVLQRGERLVMMSEPVLRRAYYEPHSYSYVRVFVFNYARFLDWAENRGFSSSLIMAMRRRHLREHIIPILANMKRAGRTDDWGAARSGIIGHFGRGSPVLAGVAILLSLMPPPILTVVRELRSAYTEKLKPLEVGGRRRTY